MPADFDRYADDWASNLVLMAVEATVKLDPDLPVIEAIQDGDRSAFCAFVEGQRRWVRGVVVGVLGEPTVADDVLQQVWGAVWNQIGTLTETRRWKTWLYRLARNAAVDAGREITRRRNLSRGFSEALRTGAGNGSGDTDSEQQRIVLQAIRGLPALYREPFVLRHLEGWSYRQIAEVLDMPVDTVETRLVRARRHLRDALNDRL